ncbi:hypothetical protein KOR42_20990 [Thalassoglobus neptunius]|uniref:Uncharacterized protein n=1 Tax=Thalassoglobus neptunius TaxID=1938619 RepID=A0A5C5X8U1_9PLAN|nr:hypothetical protein KOR42_20990 [Thalassoglobus neptunius]
MRFRFQDFVFILTSYVERVRRIPGGCTKRNSCGTPSNAHNTDLRVNPAHALSHNEHISRIPPNGPAIFDQ